MSKIIAESLKGMLDLEMMRIIMDRTADVEPAAREMLEKWSLDLYLRKPGPAADAYGEFKGTDLDLATLISALAMRRAVINLPSYQTMRQREEFSNERVVARENRHGNIMGLFSNASVFSFGVRIRDMNVVRTNMETGEETVGAPRSFALLDVSGKWHEGWKTIEFVPTARENQFLSDRRVWTENSVLVKYFVHPNRWQSFYGVPFFVTNCLIARLKERTFYLKAKIREMMSRGISYPLDVRKDQFEPAEGELTESDRVRAIQVTSFEAEVDVPEFKGQYVVLGDSQFNLVQMTEELFRLQYQCLAPLSFAKRSVELAFARHGFEREGEEKTEDYAVLLAGQKEKLPVWIKASWERDYVLPSRKLFWNRLVLFQPAVGRQGVALRYRHRQKTEYVMERSSTEESP